MTELIERCAIGEMSPSTDRLFLVDKFPRYRRSEFNYSHSTLKKNQDHNVKESSNKI